MHCSFGKSFDITLRRSVTGVVMENEPLRKHTSVRIGGPAAYFVEAASEEDVQAVLRLAAEGGVPCIVLGNGSNVLVSDAGFNGIVLCLGRLMSRAEWQGERLVAEAGLSMPRLAKMAADRGLTGVEFASGIPGTVGGGVVMNAGAHGGEMSDVVRSVRAVSKSGEPRQFGVEELNFSYRRSRFSHQREYVVTGAEIHLTPDDRAQIESRMRDFAARRRATQPLGRPSSGSVFKNPEGDYAGRLIQAAGLKGRRIGNAQVSPVHGNFIVNCGGATADEVLQLIDVIRREVAERFGVELQLEVELIGV